MKLSRDGQDFPSSACASFEHRGAIQVEHVDLVRGKRIFFLLPSPDDNFTVEKFGDKFFTAGKVIRVSPFMLS